MIANIGSKAPAIACSVFSAVEGVKWPSRVSQMRPNREMFYIDAGLCGKETKCGGDGDQCSRVWRVKVATQRLSRGGTRMILHLPRVETRLGPSWSAADWSAGGDGARQSVVGGRNVVTPACSQMTTQTKSPQRRSSRQIAACVCKRVVNGAEKPVTGPMLCYPSPAVNALSTGTL